MLTHLPHTQEAADLQLEPESLTSLCCCTVQQKEELSHSTLPATPVHGTGVDLETEPWAGQPRCHVHGTKTSLTGEKTALHPPT